MLTFKMPDVLPATASLEKFSAERAAVHVDAIAQNPHPMRSDENERVRNYIIGELIDMGIPLEVQQTNTVFELSDSDAS
jgi:hypothetical protein